MNKYTLKGLVSGKFFVTGAGFIAATAAGATQFDEASAYSTQTCLRTAGLESSAINAVVNKSFAVNYVRPEDVNSDNSVQANDKSPSKWRFATREEANTHGARFASRKVRGTQTSMGHIGFYVIETKDAPNGYVNRATGLTNAL